MKKIKFVFGLALLLMACNHKYADWYVKAQDGKIYKLKPGGCEECYFLERIDTTQINYLRP